MILNIKDANISFNGVRILKNVNFSLNSGEVHGLVGKNGAGKSTLMKILSGVYHADSGELTLFDRVIDKHSSKDALRNGIAMVYQDLSLVNTLTIAQNIFLSHHIVGAYHLLDDKKAAQESLRLLRMLGIEVIHPKTMVSSLSMGQCQLVEIAKALAGNPKILILDEPTASLSNAEIEVLFQSIQSLKAQNIAIVYITHYLEDIMKICDRVTVLRDGQSVYTAETAHTSIKEMVGHMLGDSAKLKKKTWTQPTVRATTHDDATPPLIELKGVSTAHIHDVSLTVRTGEIVGLAGLLGSGRTEILQALYGLDVITSGTYLIKGNPVSSISPQRAIAQGVSLLPEERREQGLVLDFSVEHNLVLSILKKLCTTWCINRKKSMHITDHFISYLQIKTTGRQQRIRFLSGGNQQKVVMGKCLANESDILLLDDPTFGIDIHSKIEIMNIIKEYTTQGKGVIFVSSEFDEIAEFCDRTYIVKKGNIVAQFNNNTISENTLLEAVQ